jgi:hypothetical protein
MCTFSENGDGKNAESTRARFTPRAGGRGAGTTRSSELSPSAVAFSGRPIRPEPWLRAGFAFSRRGNLRFSLDACETWMASTSVLTVAALQS